MKTSIILYLLLSVGFVQSQSCVAPVQVIVSNLKKQPSSGDKIIFKGQKTKKEFTGISNSVGKFTIQLPCGEIYDIQVASIGEEIEYNTLEIPMLEAGQQFQEMKLEIRYQLPDEFILHELQFETGKALIQPSSFPSLDEVAAFLKRKPACVIEIGGHTDSDGDETQNLILSKERALAVVRYLISKGVSANQLKAIGYGESRPIADNSTAAGKQQNRRTEIHVVTNQ